MSAGVGSCEHCGHSFRYRLIHNGFNESCYAYCAECGMTAIMDTEHKDPRTRVSSPPSTRSLPRHRSILAGGASFLSACPCGGRFNGTSPRCPSCRAALSPTAAASWIEAQANGTEKGWRWQQNWTDLYAIIINDRAVMNPWAKRALEDALEAKLPRSVSWTKTTWGSGWVQSAYFEASSDTVSPHRALSVGTRYDSDFEVGFFLDGVRGAPFEQLFPGSVSDPDGAAAEVASFVENLVTERRVLAMRGGFWNPGREFPTPTELSSGRRFKWVASWKGTLDRDIPKERRS